ncbi:MAG: MFS transporter [Pseudomonadota bacterium]
MSDALDLNSRASRYSMFYLAVVGVCVFIIQPAVVQGFVDVLGLTPEQAGYVASAEMWGLAITTIVLAFVAHRIDWRRATIVFLAISVIGNAASIGQSDPVTLSVIRTLTGLGLGGMISLPFAMVGMTANPDRNFGLLVVWVLVYGALGVLVAPMTLDAFGLDGIWLFLAAFCALGLLCVRYLPRGEATDAATESGKPLSALHAASALGGVLLFNVAIGMVWAYVFLVGTEGGIEEQSVANVLTVSQFLGIAAALLAAALAQSAGRIKPLAVGILGTGAGAALLLGDISYFIFSLAVYVFNFMWNLAQPYLLATLSGFENPARMLIRAASLQMIGFALGPFVAANLIAETSTPYANVYLIAAVGFALSWVMVLVAQLAPDARGEADAERDR